MIYTVTLNPSIDYIVRIEKVDVGNVNRMESDDKYIGGKGINVSRILSTLSIDNVALGFVGGFTGDFIEKGLNDSGIKTDFIRVDGDTRINIKLKADSETEINAKGPIISEENIKEMEMKLANISSDDIVVFAGSAPTNIGNIIYDRLISVVKESGAEIVCDFEGDNLLRSLKSKPLLVKPNIYELEKMFDVKINTVKEVESYAKQILRMGAKNVIISMGKDGAFFVNREVSFVSRNVTGVAKNSVGAGDSMVAGFVAGYIYDNNFLEAFKLGVACGSATAFSDDLASIDEIKKIYNMVEVMNL